MEKYEFDFAQKTKPFPHQADATEFIKGKESVALFDEQGLGKSKIVIDALCSDIENGIIDGALIICKKSLLRTWEDEIKKHSFLSSIILRGSTREKGYKFLAFVHFYLMNYEYLPTEIDRIKMLLKIRKLAIILDESHKIKNPVSKTAKTIFGVRELAKKRIIITGTPIANKPEDLWSQFYFLDGGKTFGTDFRSFKTEYCPTNHREAYSQEEMAKLKRLRETIEKISIRRLKNNVLELPEKLYQDVFVELEERQKKLYDTLKHDLRIEFLSYSGEQVIKEVHNILEKLLRLTQIASNPALIYDDYEETPAKFTKLDEIVREILSKEEKLIIWTSFVDNVRVLRKRYISSNPLIIFGEVPIEDRAKFVNRFQTDKDYKIMIANPSAAREGLTLTSANNAIYLDRSFNLVDYMQSQDRIHRISQTKTCKIVKLIARDTIDEYIDEILYKKQDTAAFVQGDKGSLSTSHLTKEELMDILK